MNNVIRNLTLGIYAVLGVCLIFVTVQVSDVLSEASRQGLPLITKTENILDTTNQTITTANKTLATVNAPCVGFHGSVTCGTLAQIDQTAKNFGIVAAQSALQVKQSGTLITAASQSITEVGSHVQIVADNLSQTAKAATGAVNQATTDLQTANATIAAAQPLLGHLDDVTVSANKSVLDFNALLQDPNLPLVLKSSAGITSSMDQILARGYLVEAKATQCYLYPTWKCKLSGLVVPTFQIAGPLIQAFK